MGFSESLTNGAAVLGTARRVSMQSRDLCRSSEWLVVSARLLRRRRPWIAGVADEPDEPTVRQRIREFVRSGVLRMDEPLCMSASKSEGWRECAICARLGLAAREIRYVENRASEGENEESPDPPLRCAVCLRDIPEGTGHFRFAESRCLVEVPAVG